MIRKNVLFFLLAMAVVSTAMAFRRHRHSLARSSQSSDTIVKPLLEFTSKIFKPFAGKENVVLSPISMHTALSMVLIGTHDDTETKDELLETLGLEKLNEEEIYECLDEYSALIAEFKKISAQSKQVVSDLEKNPDKPYPYYKPPLLDIFNMVITKNLGEIRPAFKRKVRKYFNSSIVRVDDEKPETKSEVLDKLNSWAKEAGFSQPIMTQKELDEKFAAYLLSAIHVHGFWFNVFDEHQNKNLPIFYNHGQKDQPVKGTVLSQIKPRNSRYLEFTSADKAKYKYLHDLLSKSKFAEIFEELSSLNIQVAQVPLQGNLSFTIFEPLNPSGSGGELDKLLNQLTHTEKTSNSNKFEKVFSLLDSEFGDNPIEEITFPKFKFENEIDMKEHLQSIGLKLVFERNSSQIDEIATEPVYISKVTHQATIDVNKFGIKAAAFTKIQLLLINLGHLFVNIKNPFLFSIRYDKLPLFIGRLDSLKE